MVEANRRKRHERYNRIRKLKESFPCSMCGNFFPYYVMDFHHRTKETKVAEVQALVKSLVFWTQVEAEIAKCNLVCTRCHRLETYHGITCYRTRQYHHHRAILDELKRTPCLDCGKTFDPCQMDFDHTGEALKVANISQLAAGPMADLVSEIAKCHLVCANCHRIREYTGERPYDPNHSRMLVQTFRTIAKQTPFPKDKRDGRFPFPELLGTMPDEELATRIRGMSVSTRSFKSDHFKNEGLSKEMVAYYRRKAGIPAYRSPPKPPAKKPWHSLLGTVPDPQVVRVAGLTPSTIAYHRKRLGIPAYRQTRNEHVEATT